jgi:hypothetical protein
MAFETTVTQSGPENLLETPGVERRHLGSLSINETIGSSFNDPRDLGFETAQIFAVDTDEQAQGELFELRFDGEPVRTERFAKLLEAISPTPSFWPPNDHGHHHVRTILNDWVIYEKPDGRFERLAKEHSGLRSWAQLGREYPDLKAAIEPLDPETHLLPWMLPGNEDIVSPAEFVEDWGGAESLANYNPLITGAELAQLLTEIYGTERARSQIIHAMKAAVKAKPKDTEQAGLKGLADEEIFAEFHALDIELRNRIVSVSDLQRDYDSGNSRGWSRSELTERFTAIYLKRHCVTFETDDGQLMYAHGLAPGEDIERAYASRQKIYKNSGPPRGYPSIRGRGYEYEVMELNTATGKQTAIVPGSIKRQEIGLIPTVRWTVGADGKRVYQNQPEHPRATSYKHNVPSGATGLMVLAYLQPNQYRRWKITGRLPKLEGEQEMGAAQVPLLALQRAGQLLNNPLVAQAEKLA